MKSGQVTASKFTVKDNLSIETGKFNGGVVTVNMAIIANSINEVASYTNLYDKYKICSYSVKFIPRGDMFTIDKANIDASQNFIFVTALDYDDATSPTEEQALFNYRNHKWTRGTKVHSRYVRYPHVMKWVQETAGSGGNVSNERAGWIDAAGLNVPHYGLKWGCKPGGSAGSTIYMDVLLSVYVKWAGRR